MGNQGKLPVITITMWCFLMRPTVCSTVVQWSALTTCQFPQPFVGRINKFSSASEYRVEALWNCWSLMTSPLSTLAPSTLSTTTRWEARRRSGSISVWSGVQAPTLSTRGGGADGDDDEPRKTWDLHKNRKTQKIISEIVVLFKKIFCHTSSERVPLHRWR